MNIFQIYYQFLTCLLPFSQQFTASFVILSGELRCMNAFLECFHQIMHMFTLSYFIHVQIMLCFYSSNFPILVMSDLKCRFY